MCTSRPSGGPLWERSSHSIARRILQACAAGLAGVSKDLIETLLASWKGATGWNRDETPIPRFTHWSTEPGPERPQGTNLLNETTARHQRAELSDE